MGFAAIKDKARELFLEAGFISHIQNEEEYGQALALVDELTEDYDNQEGSRDTFMKLCVSLGND